MILNWFQLITRFLDDGVGTSYEITGRLFGLVYKPDHPSTDRRFVDEFGLFVEGFSHVSGKL